MIHHTTRTHNLKFRTPRAAVLLLVALAVLLTSCAPKVTGALPTFAYNPATPSEPPARPELTLEDDDRILVLSPHPDDEVLATGGIVQEALARGIPVEVVFYTNGDNNEFAYLFYRKAFTLEPGQAISSGQTRALEALQAGRQLGLNIRDEVFLGYPDFGTMEIWKNRWGDREPFRSMFTEQNAVPYWFAQTPDAPHVGESILTDLETALLDFKPTKVFVSHPADTNPDHAALNLFARTALWNLRDVIQPEVYAFLTHYGDWPQPRGLLYDAPHEPPAKFDEKGRWVTFPLTPEEARKKLDALKKHDTQYSTSKDYLESYLRSNELFDPVVDIPLAPGTEGVLLLPSGAGVPAGSELPEGAWTDGATRRVRVEGDELVFTVALDPASSADVETELDAFGYRADRPFGEMPKIHVAANRSGHEVTERRQGLPDDSVQVTRAPGQIEVRIPLALLENPERIFLSAEAKGGGAPLDVLPWVALDLGEVG
jgi:LmbE family N-acetylglucosaminyl deacetylase